MSGGIYIYLQLVKNRCKWQAKNVARLFCIQTVTRPLFCFLGYTFTAIREIPLNILEGHTEVNLWLYTYTTEMCENLFKQSNRIQFEIESGRKTGIWIKSEKGVFKTHKKTFMIYQSESNSWFLQVQYVRKHNFEMDIVSLFVVAIFVLKLPLSV